MNLIIFIVGVIAGAAIAMVGLIVYDKIDQRLSDIEFEIKHLKSNCYSYKPFYKDFKESQEDISNGGDAKDSEC